MGFELVIQKADSPTQKKTYQPQSFSVQEAATPLAAGDSSGQVGSIAFTVPRPDPYIDRNNPLMVVGPAYLEGCDLELTDTIKGVTKGRVTSLSGSYESGTLDVTAASRLGELNIYDVQAAPFVGLLGDAFEYYLSLAGITDEVFVDPTIATQFVTFPGWNGELWFHLKQFTAALQLDISLVSGVILLRPIRTRVATQGRDISRQVSLGGGTKAQFVEAYYYQNREIINELVYPPGGWSPEVATINVNAGEYIEEVFELNASLSSIEQPVMQSFVTQHHSSSSVYTVTGDDGLDIAPALWASRGGWLRVDLNPDTTSITVKIQAPGELPSSTGETLTSFGISLASEAGTGRYSTLRIRGTGVAFDRQVVRTPTGLSIQETGTEVGVTIDNPFMSTFEQVAIASAWAVRGYDGSALMLSGSVSTINRNTDPGILRLASYQFAQDLYEGMTYAQVQTANASRTYEENFEYVNSLKPVDYEDQVFGNVAGSRVKDEGSARWYRIRSGTISPENIQFEAEDDTTHGDAQNFFQGLTYAQAFEGYSDYDYRTIDLMGLRKL